MCQSGNIRLFLNGSSLTAETADGMSRKFDFPAVAVSINGRRYEPMEPAAEPVLFPDGSWVAEFSGGICSFKVTVSPGGAGWFFKQLEISSDCVLPTPDYVEVDFQKQYAEALERRGYMCTVSGAGDNTNDEQGSGVSPGCGYPLVGKDMFTALEHPAAYNTIVSSENGFVHWQLRHFPVWKDRKITSCRAVTGIGKDPDELMFSYIDTLRLAPAKSPLVAFCTFWSDPYAGNREYSVSKDSYCGFIDAFNKLDLHPDIYTLDAGWQDRFSILRAKESYGGEQALMDIGNKVRSSGAGFSLWVSPNGPVGISEEFLRAHGFAVGTGASCHYSYGEYGVLMDEKLEDELTKRACELVSEKYKVVHFKVDWDNECAANEDFSEIYPTRSHVREASLNMMARINHKARKICPQLKTRNGRWPSPWHIMNTTHLSLPSGGDCEYGHLPALSQRDAASNHRDFIYWCVFCRDKSVLPLDVLDNHEFGHSIRNPFQETPEAWSNACVWAVMRGSSYHQYTIMPESLEKWQADILRSSIDLLRKNPQKILTGRSKMVGKNPMQGSIYGFFHPENDEKGVLALRNSSPFPMEYTLPEDFPFYIQTYPDCRYFNAGEKIIFAPHEVKVLNSRKQDEKPFPDAPCQIQMSDNGNAEYFLPASRRPDVLPIHQIPTLEKRFFNEISVNGNLELTFGVSVPWRTRSFKMFLKLPRGTASGITLRTSRFQNCRESSYTVPLTEVPAGLHGSGEKKNHTSSSNIPWQLFTADLPQGGNVFFSLTLHALSSIPDGTEVWVSGYEATARYPEEFTFQLSHDLLLPMAHPLGFPINLKLI